MEPSALGADPRMHWFSLGDLLRENARRFPNKTAIVCGDIRLSYPEFDLRVRRVANALRDKGVAPGDRIVWLGQICHSSFELLFAAARLGAMLCPINWRLAPYEMAFVLDDIDPRIVFWQETEIGDQVRAGRVAASCDATWIQVDRADGYEAFLARGADHDPEIPVDPYSPVLVIYTAAFDGRPGGAMLHHHGLLTTALIRGHFAEVSDETVYLSATNVYHVGNWDYGSLPTVLFGGTNVFMRRWDAAEAARLVDRERVTMAFMAGPMYDALLAEAAAADCDMSSLQPPSYFSPRVGGYGQTEIHGVQSFRGYGSATGSHGRPSPFAEVRILDEVGQELPMGEVGEIAFRGAVVMNGYWNRPERNSRTHTDGWRRTNDLGRRESDGSLTFIGPKLRMLKSGAENIYPVEVEHAIETHDAVRRCAVIGVPDAEWEQSVLAVVQLAEHASISAAEVVAHCRTQVASYKKPRHVEFVDALPITEHGRIDYDVLDERFGGGGYPGGG